MPLITEKKPVELGYRMPPEWAVHRGTELHWPHNRETWPGERLRRVEEVYARIIEVLHHFETVHLFVASQEIRDRAVSILDQREIDWERLRLYEQPINDVWARDCGPIFVRSGRADVSEYAVTDWEYNAWGGKYPPYDDDNRLPARVSEIFGLPRFEAGMVLEGGAIEVSGDGTLLTTESVLLNPNRNPALDKKKIEERLKDYLGIKRVLWLSRGLAGDDTDGHIDDLCRFLNDSTILAMTTDDPSDINYPALTDNLERLKSFTTPDGKSYHIETLPMPVTRIEGTTVDGSEYVPASYANYYVANGVVLLPFYDQRYDEQAKELLQQYFPGRKVVGIDCRDLVWGQGSIHCITQQWYGI